MRFAVRRSTLGRVTASVLACATGLTAGIAVVGALAFADIYCTGGYCPGNAQDNTMHGTNFADLIEGFGGNDSIDGRSGDDELRGSLGSDRAFGEGGVDRIYGGPGSDRFACPFGTCGLMGAGGNDSIEGGEDGDTAWGGTNSDGISGQGGNDALVGSDDSTTDYIFGGDGSDYCYVTPADTYTNCNYIG